jgi:hypothetical protein
MEVMMRIQKSFKLVKKSLHLNLIAMKTTQTSVKTVGKSFQKKVVMKKVVRTGRSWKKRLGKLTMTMTVMKRIEIDGKDRLLQASLKPKSIEDSY